MVVVRNLRVRSFDLDYLDLLWEVEPTSEDLFDYDFYVLRSENEYSGYAPLAGPFVDKYHFRDTTLRGRHSFFRKWFYRIRVVDRKTAAEEIFPRNTGVALRAMPDLHALEIARNNRIRLENGSGRLVWVFPIRTFGQRCTCVDPVTERKLRSMCPVCYDTRWVGGFHRPIEVHMQIIAPPEANTMADMGEVQNINGMGKLSNFPEVHPRYVVVEAENERWRVGEGIRKMEKARALVRQEFPLHRIPVGDIEYTLPIKLTPDEIGGLQPTPLRLYTNPQDVGEGAEESGYSELRRFYGL